MTLPAAFNPQATFQQRAYARQLEQERLESNGARSGSLSTQHLPGSPRAPKTSIAPVIGIDDGGDVAWYRSNAQAQETVVDVKQDLPLRKFRDNGLHDYRPA